MRLAVSFRMSKEKAAGFPSRKGRWANAPPARPSAAVAASPANTWRRVDRLILCALKVDYERSDKLHCVSGIIEGLPCAQTSRGIATADSAGTSVSALATAVNILISGEVSRACRKRDNSGGGCVSSGVRNKPTRFNASPRELRLDHT